MTERLIKEVLGEHYESATPILYQGNTKLVGDGHSQILSGLNSKPIPDSQIEKINAAYILQSASMFCTDHIMDGDDPFSGHSDILLSPLLASASFRVLASLESGDNFSIHEILDIWMKMHRTFATAMLLESKDKYLKENETSFHYVHRSEVFLATFRILSKIVGSRPTDEQIGMLERFIELMQLADDLGDWREDFRSDKMTRILSKAIENIGQDRLEEKDLEEYMYLSGYYEEVGEEICSELEALVSRAGSVFPDADDAYVSFVKRQIQRLNIVIENFRTVKLGGDPVKICALQ